MQRSLSEKVAPVGVVANLYLKGEIKMNVKDNRKQNKRLISEIKPGTLFKHGDLYFIRTSDTVYRRNITVTGISLCMDSRPEYEYNDWYEPIEAICVSDGRPMSFRYGELVEVFPDAFISVGNK